MVVILRAGVNQRGRDARRVFGQSRSAHRCVGAKYRGCESQADQPERHFLARSPIWPQVYRVCLEEGSGQPRKRLRIDIVSGQLKSPVQSHRPAKARTLPDELDVLHPPRRPAPLVGRPVLQRRLRNQVQWHGGSAKKPCQAACNLICLAEDFFRAAAHHVCQQLSGWGRGQNGLKGGIFLAARLASGRSQPAVVQPAALLQSGMQIRNFLMKFYCEPKKISHEKSEVFNCRMGVGCIN